MTDLSFVPFEDIEVELGKRYPGYVLAVAHHREGQINQPPMFRFSFGGTAGPVMALGLAAASYKAVEAALINQMHILPPGSGLDFTPPS